MIPGVSNLEWVRGDSYSKFGRVRTKVWDGLTSSYVPGPYRDLTGWTGLAQVRESVDAPAVLFELAVTLGNQGTSLGSFFLTATPADTADLTIFEGVWDLQWTTNAGEILTYVGGTVTLKKDVSRVVV
jgi:hypothetical protein